jgi:Flp pilus assembly protein TadG
MHRRVTPAGGARFLPKSGLPGSGLGDCKAVAALEFALVAPVMLMLFFATVDICRAYIVWQEVDNAAEAVAQAAEKLSVTSGQPLTMLNSTQMQNAMSTIYAQMPGLVTGQLTGKYGVTLSSVVYSPSCAYTNPSLCNANGFSQTAYVQWSSYLQEVAGAPSSCTASSQLMCNASVAPLRGSAAAGCVTSGTPTGSAALSTVRQFTNDSNQLKEMLNPTLVALPMVLVPQIVADVQYTYSPPLMPAVAKWLFVANSITFYASATLPAPLGGTKQAITYNTTGGNASYVVLSCLLPAQAS